MDSVYEVKTLNTKLPLWQVVETIGNTYAVIASCDCEEKAAALAELLTTAATCMGRVRVDWFKFVNFDQQ